MTKSTFLERGRKAFIEQRWKDAYKELSKAEREGSITSKDLELLATAAYLTGKFDECIECWTRAHNSYLKNDRPEAAIRCAFWLGFKLLNKGDGARGGGWIARANSLLTKEEIDCVEEGYLLLPIALKSLREGNTEIAMSNFKQAGKIGNLYRDRDLMTFSKLGQGQTMIRLGKAEGGLNLLDEAMAAVDSGELSTVVTGIVYCAVIETCMEIFDLGRAHEWTDALSDWCASQPHLVPFRGPCLIRRSEILQLHGKWMDAIKEAEKAVAILTQPKGESAAGAAYYQLGELHRLQGDFEMAEVAYKQASKWGKKPQPGFSLMRMLQGKITAAERSIENALKEANNLKMKLRVLPVYTEIMLAADNTEHATKAAEELVELSADLDAPYLQTIVAFTCANVNLSSGDVDGAFDQLHIAQLILEQLKAPYETARVRFLIGQALLKTGDEDSAMMEFDAARWTFQELNATPDLQRVNAIVKHNSTKKPHGLTKRELEVLQLITEGKTNKAIAKELFISERTVERHISNIFSKLNTSSRAAATAYAYEHGLV